MIKRRDFLTAAAATATLLGTAPGRLAPLAAQGRLSQSDLLRFEPLGNVTLIHITDLHGQLMPLHFREPSVNIGVGEAKGQVPHLTGAAALKAFDIAPKSAEAYALTDVGYVELARHYGRLGGLDRIATIVKAIRAERDGRTLLLDGGDTWTNSWTSLQTRGQDMVDCMALLKPDAMTGHWEFTLGAERVKEITGKLGFPFLAQNVRERNLKKRFSRRSRCTSVAGSRLR